MTTTLQKSEGVRLCEPVIGRDDSPFAAARQFPAGSTGKIRSYKLAFSDLVLVEIIQNEKSEGFVSASLDQIEPLSSWEFKRETRAK
jgi:hypothetical protein